MDSFDKWRIGLVVGGATTIAVGAVAGKAYEESEHQEKMQGMEVAAARAFCQKVLKLEEGQSTEEVKTHSEKKVGLNNYPFQQKRIRKGVEFVLNQGSTGQVKVNVVCQRDFENGQGVPGGLRVMHPKGSACLGGGDASIVCNTEYAGFTGVEVTETPQDGDPSHAYQAEGQWGIGPVFNQFAISNDQESARSYSYGEEADERTKQIQSRYADLFTLGHKKLDQGKFKTYKPKANPL